MRAAFIEKTGTPDVIQVGDLPNPEPGPGQVLVRVRAVAINPFDLYLRGGVVAMPMTFPYVIASDFAGVVEDMGPGTTGHQVGDRVWGSNQGLMGRQGVAAEFAAIDEEWLNPIPARLPDADAAAMAMAGITAHLGLFERGRLKPGESVYVPGGSGGVGSMVVQMAKAAGARVATSAGGPEKIDLCKQLGADLVLNYKTDDLVAGLRDFAPEGIDVWYETQREPKLETSVPLLRKRGRMILMAGRSATPALPLGSFYPRDGSLLGFAMFNASAEEQKSATSDMVRWIEEGRLRPLVGRVFPLDQAADAHRFLESNTLGGAGTLTGKVVLQID
ncbi:NADPH:quinone reductase [Paludisphaera mucosa]|uniref:NADPH:quinone reductase n=1 Tax=Paludisphaera mucosa TaxID=3030827 RepID=A0ABT6F712_9BACT|nr:NADPH:quinone reductase [Paludisphaera mucosa]MDG3003378.1 NADPH:quinone reductase [Paludisphaera mucosa]